jgi:asparagine synthase (glutamine-hydrolysing)
MCGIVGWMNFDDAPVERAILENMTDTIRYRGPDSCGYFVETGIGFGFRRLSIIDLEGGSQPIYNEDHTVVLICNGEIYNYQELKDLLKLKGHQFRTNTDVEVLVHLYEEYGTEFVKDLNGQFAFALYDRRKKSLFLARDHFGIIPLFYSLINAGRTLIFASEIKALLAHPLVQREVDLIGLDQVFSFPGVVSPTTMFKNIKSLPGGHSLSVNDGQMKIREYWDLIYPEIGEYSSDRPESYYEEQLCTLLSRSVAYRLQADVPVGFYLSGGLDSSLIAALIKEVSPKVDRHSFSIFFHEKEINEEKYQLLMAEHLKSIHHGQIFTWSDIVEGLTKAVYHSETPLKETFNAASLLLSRNAKRQNISVILTGEGSDELLAGYVGYRFDQFRETRAQKYSLETILEDEMREQLWGDNKLLYEKDYYAFRGVKSALYSNSTNEALQDADCLDLGVVNKERIRGRHYVHQRSYLDFKLRLSDHLISDHGDRMTMAHSVEGRYPFLDIQLIEFLRNMPVNLKINQFSEKYILKKVAARFLPREIIEREKFGFVAQDSASLLQRDIPWVRDLLSYERIKKDGYFNPETVERLKKLYGQKGFRLNIPFESDLLIVVLTFNIFLDLFNLPRIG